MKKISLKNQNFTYPIYIGKNIFSKFLVFSSIFSIQKNRKIILITEKKIFSKYIKKMILNLKNTKLYIVPGGEKIKSFFYYKKILFFLLKNLIRRNSCIIAIGGGSLIDLVGFASSTYLRGISLFIFPTTLLSQVDSSIGGKNSINFSNKKNIIGTFYQPSLVVIDIIFLSSLKSKELSNGLAEIIKYAISFDKIFFHWLEKNIDSIFSLKEKEIFYCIEKCCKIKCRIVSKDEKEKGIRSLLNLGHTYGHAIESLFKGKWNHGESVSLGIVLASYSSFLLKIFSKKEIQRTKEILEKSNLPINFPHKIKIDKFLKIMKYDKKNLEKKNALILPLKIGKVKKFYGISEDIIISSIESINNKIFY
ncbi:3-dehydroquinate synthase [bacterium endosymbiont of Pedicinus badii]|uniref:3-dehydroquinate synthase n=1 Tax=bacterium endosymbiont of Pedicinus badii TaxID=1719126 RepID=UPI0009B9FBA7|nr:3-dehydroquinate synthase [bacterium endosymbiont of Pedicinus badii]OQM34093.1 hypothetical protein AOQ89_01980 [bacterium endosymbiont of Pedicinus badii]